MTTGGKLLCGCARDRSSKNAAKIIKTEPDVPRSMYMRIRFRKIMLWHKLFVYHAITRATAQHETDKLLEVNKLAKFANS